MSAPFLAEMTLSIRDRPMLEVLGKFSPNLDILVTFLPLCGISYVIVLATLLS